MKIPPLIAGCSILTLGIPCLNAGSASWNGSVNNLWSQAGNWDGLAPSSGGAGDLVFENWASTASFNNLTNFTAHSITINGLDHLCTGANILTLDGNITDSSDAWQIFNLPLALRNNVVVGVNAGNLFLNGSISNAGGGTGGLTKTGDATLTISGTAAYTGATNIDAGIFEVTGSALLKTTSSIALNGAIGSAAILPGPRITMPVLHINDSANPAGFETDHFGAVPVLLNGGSLYYTAADGGGATPGTTTVQNLSIPTYGKIGVLPVGSGMGGATLVIADLTTTATTMASFQSQSGTLGSSTEEAGHVKIARINGSPITNVHGIIGGWATVTGGPGEIDFATYDPADGIKAAAYSGTSIMLSSSSTDNINSFGGEVVSTDKTINALASKSISGNTVIAAGKTLTLESGGLIFGGDADWNQNHKFVSNQGGTGKLTAGVGGNYHLYLTEDGNGAQMRFDNVQITDNGANPVTFVKGGLGSVIFGLGKQAYTGGTVINQGGLIIASENGIQNCGAMTVNSGGYVKLADNITSHITGLMTLAGGEMQGDVPNVSSGGTWVIDSGIHVIGNGLTSTISAVSVSGNLAINVDPGATLNVSGNFGLQRPITDPIIKSGSGTMILAGENTTTGTLAVNQGRVILTGAVAGAVDIAAGAEFAAIGTVAGNLYVNGALEGTGTVGAIQLTASGLVQPGTEGAGVLSAASLNWDGGSDTLAPSQMQFTLSNIDATCTQIALIGALMKGNTDAGTVFKFDFQNSGFGTAQAPGIYTLLTFNSATGFTASNFSYTNLGLTNDLTGTFVMTATSLGLQVIPEPGTVGMLIGGIGWLCLGQRMRRRSR